MDLRTGRMYDNYEAARADGVPNSDIVLIEQQPNKPPTIAFPKKVFGRLKNITPKEHEPV